MLINADIFFVVAYLTCLLASISRKHIISWQNIALASSLIYFSPLVVTATTSQLLAFNWIDKYGEAQTHFVSTSESSPCYWIAAIVLLVQLVFAELNRTSTLKPSSPSEYTTDKFFIWICTLFAILLWVSGAIAAGGTAYILAEKHESILLENRALALSRFVLIIAFSAAFSSKSWPAFGLSASCLMLDVLSGHRSTIALALISILIIHGAEKPNIVKPSQPTRLWGRIKILTAAAILVTIFVYAKHAIGQIKSTDPQQFLDSISSTAGLTDAISESFLSAEPVITQAVLIEATNTNYSQPFDATAQSILASFIPYGGFDIFPYANQGTHLQDHLFGSVSFGMATNMWAWANSISLAAVPITALLLLSAAAYCFHVASSSRSIATRAIFISFIPHIVFYCHRNDIPFCINAFKNHFVAGFSFLLLATALCKYSNQNRAYHRAE